ncbi:hypothetical protein K402DRAFT_28300 [Aulographum hederae CBS 113979]|uniref:HMG box domain-containing protein n=1 Tax=Aulographum hederae CBS 113979 TaxID=1176131 RepID=A0A6G1H652_9PEZI|nr:hypothetical protein K402DRAFT_28300 [Aulographum hederae CBS 113979]
MLKTMSQQAPPTPPAGSPQLLHDLHHVAQHNSGRAPFDYEAQDDHYMHSGQHSNYNSPVQAMQEPQYMPPVYPSQRYPDLHDQNGSGLGIQYEYGSHGPAYYQGEAQSYTDSPYMQHASPPTPHSSNHSDSGARRTRSGRSLARTSSPQASAPALKAPKPKKSKAKGDKPKTPKLTAPLSVLTKDYANIPVRDIDAWVNRAASVRHEEAEKRNGYITRPMNSFMLYRSAYAERTKMWCLQNNHQIVSSVSGESWPMEPREIREQYNEYARIERHNHQAAHPNYKFSPSKTTSVAAKKRKGVYSDDEELDIGEETFDDLDDPDGEWGPSSRKHRSKNSRTRNNISAPHASSWEANNEGKPLPSAIGAGDGLYHQYYQTSIHPSPMMGQAGVEDIRLRRMDSPGMGMMGMHHQVHPFGMISHQHPMGQSPISHMHHPHHPMSAAGVGSLIGMPGAAGAHQDLFVMNSRTGSPITQVEQQEIQVDPSLLAYEYEPHATGDQRAPAHGQDFAGMEGFGAGEGGAADPYLGAPEMEVGESGWEDDGQGGEFDKWME